MGDCEEADLVYMCNTLKAIGEKLRDLTHVEKNHSKSQKKITSILYQIVSKS